MNADPLGRNLRDLRKARGLTQRRLAEKARCARTYISAIETGTCSASIAVLRKIARALETTPSDLLRGKEESARTPDGSQAVPVINDSMRGRLLAPTIEDGRVVGDSDKVLCLPDVGGLNAFAAYLPDDAMAPDFHRGDLVVFSMGRELADGTPALVDLGNGKVLFRRVLEFPGKGLRLEATDRAVEPVLRESAEGIRVWPAIGRWAEVARPERKQDREDLS